MERAAWGSEGLLEVLGALGALEAFGSSEVLLEVLGALEALGVLEALGTLGGRSLKCFRILNKRIFRLGEFLTLLIISVPYCIRPACCCCLFAVSAFRLEFLFGSGALLAL